MLRRIPAGFRTATVAGAVRRRIAFRRSTATGGSRGTAMPARLTNAHAGITLHRGAVRRHRHRPLNLPPARVVIETPQRTLRPGRKHQTRDRIRQVRQPHPRRGIEVRRTIGLHRDHQREIEPGRQRLRQPVRGNRHQTYPPTPRPVVADQGVRLHQHLHPRQRRIRRHHRLRHAHRRRLRHTRRHQRVTRHQGQKNFPRAARQLVRPPRHGRPRLAHIRVIRSPRPLAPHRRPAIHMHEKPPRGRRAQPKESGRIRDRPKSLLRAIHRHRHPLQRLIRTVPTPFTRKDPAHHLRPRHRRRPRRLEPGLERTSPHPVGIAIHRNARRIENLLPIKPNPHPRRPRQVLQEKQGRHPPVRRHRHPHQQGTFSVRRPDPSRIQDRVARQGTREPQHHLAPRRHPGLPQRR